MTSARRTPPRPTLTLPLTPSLTPTLILTLTLILTSARRTLPRPRPTGAASACRATAGCSARWPSAGGWTRAGTTPMENAGSSTSLTLRTRSMASAARIRPSTAAGTATCAPARRRTCLGPAASSGARVRQPSAPLHSHCCSRSCAPPVLTTRHASLPTRTSHQACSASPSQPPASPTLPSRRFPSRGRGIVDLSVRWTTGVEGMRSTSGEELTNWRAWEPAGTYEGRLAKRRGKGRG